MNSKTWYYLRESGGEQNFERQLAAFVAMGASERDIIIDRDAKGGYTALKTALLCHGDTLIIQSLHHLSWNKDEIKNELEYFKMNGIRLKVMDLPTTMTDYPEWVLDVVSDVLTEVCASIAQRERESKCDICGSVENEAPLFDKYAWRWFETYSKPNIATATINLYRHLLTHHIIPAFSGMLVENIRVEDMQHLFNNMDTSKETKYKAKRLLNQVLNAAVDDGLLIKNPLRSGRIKITGAESTTTAAYSVEQMQYLIQHIGDIKQPQDRVYIALQALHPLRLEEVLGLKWSDVDLKNMALHINRAVTHPDRNRPEVKNTKTKSSVRTLGLSQLALPYLLQGNADDFILGGNSPLSYTQVRRMCDRIKKDIGFTENITPKRFRATVRTDLYDKTRDIKLVQAAAGHTTAEMTLKHYVKGRGDIVQAAAAIESAYTT